MHFNRWSKLGALFVLLFRVCFVYMLK